MFFKSSVQKKTKPAKSGQPPFLITTSSWLVLILTASLLYGNFLANPLVFDDEPWFENVAAIYANLLTSFGLRWFPYVSLGWTWSVAGLDLLWLRLGNLLLHAANSVVLFVFLRQLFDCVLGKQKGVGARSTLSPVWLAFFGALLFTLHPAVVYSVAYLIQRSILMATLFSLLTLLAYLQGLLREKQIWFVAAAVCYFFAVFSKEHSIMVPAVALALTFLLRQPSILLFKRVALVFALFAIVGASAIFMAKDVIGSVYEPTVQTMMELMPESSGPLPDSDGLNMGNAYPLSVLTQCFLFFKYLLLWIIPYPGWMSIDLRNPLATHFLSWPHTVGSIGFVLYGVMAIKLLLTRGQKGLAGFALLFPWILFATELASVRIQEPFVLYRSYLWMTGLFALLPLLFGRLGARFGFALLLAISLLLIPLSWNRLTTFSSPILLWDDAEKLVRDKTDLYYADRIYYNRGSAYSKAGLTQQAIDNYTKAIELKPGMSSKYYFNRGNAYSKLGQTQRAIDDYTKAIEINPGISSRYYGRCLAYLNQSRLVEALSDINMAIQINSNYAEAIGVRGLINGALGNVTAAIKDLKRSCELGQPPACTRLNMLLNKNTNQRR